MCFLPPRSRDHGPTRQQFDGPSFSVLITYLSSEDLPLASNIIAMTQRGSEDAAETNVNRFRRILANAYQVSFDMGVSSTRLSAMILVAYSSTSPSQT